MIHLLQSDPHALHDARDRMRVLPPLLPIEHDARVPYDTDRLPSGQQDVPQHRPVRREQRQRLLELGRHGGRRVRRGAGMVRGGVVVGEEGGAGGCYWGGHRGGCRGGYWVVGGQRIGQGAW